MWYTFDSLEAFNTWHNSVCAALGMPYPGINAATGEIDENAQWVESYTSVIEVAADDWRAVIDDDIATSYSDGLGVPCDSPPAPIE